jgi:hypothetical protein
VRPASKHFSVPLLTVPRIGNALVRPTRMPRDAAVSEKEAGKRVSYKTRGRPGAEAGPLLF